MRMKLYVRSSVQAEDFSQHLVEEVADAGGEVATDPEEKPDMVVAVGGDGTMLAAVRNAIEWDVPVLGFNLGTLGFLTEAEPEELSAVVKRLVTGDYQLHERLSVSAAIGGVRADGINDVVVEKVDTTRLIALAVVIDGSPFATYRADGLIVATPTGSTAYSLSAGGPIIDPGVPALVLTPVASHSLFDKSIVLPADAMIEATVVTDREVRVNVDKCDLGEIGEGETVRISKGERPARFVTFSSSTFPGLVRTKFGLS